MIPINIQLAYMHLAIGAKQWKLESDLDIAKARMLKDRTNEAFLQAKKLMERFSPATDLELDIYNSHGNGD